MFIVLIKDIFCIIIYIRLRFKIKIELEHFNERSITLYVDKGDEVSVF